jgi:hypothetical protein
MRLRRLQVSQPSFLCGTTHLPVSGTCRRLLYSESITFEIVRPRTTTNEYVSPSFNLHTASFITCITQARDFAAESLAFFICS